MHQMDMYIKALPLARQIAACGSDYKSLLKSVVEYSSPGIHNSTCAWPAVRGLSVVWDISVAAVALFDRRIWWCLIERVWRKPLQSKGLAIKSEFALRFLRTLWYKMRRFAGIARRAQTHTRIDTMTWVPSA